MYMTGSKYMRNAPPTPGIPELWDGSLITQDLTPELKFWSYGGSYFMSNDNNPIIAEFCTFTLQISDSLIFS